MSIRNSFQTSTESQSTLVSMKAAICERYTEIIEEIDPEAYRDTFVERNIFTVQEYDDLMKICLKNNRAVAFLKRLLHGNSIFALKTFLWVLRRSGSEQLAHSLENDFYMIDGEEEGNLPEVDCSQCTLMTAILDAHIIIDQHISDNCSEKEYPLLENPLPYWDSQSIPLRISVHHDNQSGNTNSYRKVISWLESSEDKKMPVRSTEEKFVPHEETPPKHLKCQDMDDIPAGLEQKFFNAMSSSGLTEAGCATYMESSTNSCTKDSSELNWRWRSKTTELTTLSSYQHKLPACKKRRSSAASLSDQYIQITNTCANAASSNVSILTGAHVCQQPMNNLQTSYNYDNKKYCHEGFSSLFMSALSPDDRREDAYSERRSSDSLDEIVAKY